LYVAKRSTTDGRDGHVQCSAAPARFRKAGTCNYLFNEHYNTNNSKFNN